MQDIRLRGISYTCDWYLPLFHVFLLPPSPPPPPKESHRTEILGSSGSTSPIHVKRMPWASKSSPMCLPYLRDVELVREMILSLAGHFDRRTMGPSLDILRFCWTFIILCPTKKKAFAGHFYTGLYRIPLSDILLNFLWLDILSGENLPLRRTFENFVGHVRRDWQILRTLLLNGPLASL